MNKVLRSLIHENIPFDLRVEFDLLSRRRDIVNEEKQGEILKLLKKYNIDDITNLAPGTNRYGFKLNGFVIKVATDNDGKIDNLKEFKMTKRFYPDVSKTYEVSENGNLLVAEYIPPFQSYSEMLRYADDIRKILSRISEAGYLIGDVGISSVNYGNWGIRPGSETPTCFDYAYIYDVTSDLFICRECGSMLVPDKDFAALNCSNNLCGVKVLFESLRGRIGNDIHRHEIGDLTEEGYLLTQSNVLTELTPNRSNYLELRSKPKKEKSKKEKDDEKKVEYKPFIMDWSSSHNKERENKKMNKDIDRLAEMVVDKAIKNNERVFMATATAVKKENPKSKVNPKNPRIDKNFENSKPNKNVKNVEESNNVEVIVGDSNVAFSGSIINNDPDPELSELPESYFDYDKFKNEFQRAISKLSNRLALYLENKKLFNVVGNYLRDGKMTSQTFYKNVQNAIFRSLTDFCGFKTTSVKNSNGSGFHKLFTPPDTIEGKNFENTVIFIERMWNTKEIIDIEDPEDAFYLYESLYNDEYNEIVGIQEEWLDVLIKYLKEKIVMEPAGLSNLLYLIANPWVETNPTGDELIRKYFSDTDFTDNDDTETFEESSDNEIIGFSQHMDLSIDNEDDDSSHDEYDQSEENENDESEDEEYQEIDYLTVDIYPEEDFDVIRIKTSDIFGKVEIPMYTDFDAVEVKEETSIAKSLIESKNGVWDWLKTMVPDLTFKTKDPDYYLRVNDIDPEEDQSKIIILGDENNEYLMGVFFISGIYIIGDEGIPEPTFDDELLYKLNKIVIDNIGYCDVSHLKKSLISEENLYKEEEIKSMIKYITENNEDNETDNSDDSLDETGYNQEETDLEKAAVDAVLSDENTSIKDHEVVPDGSDKDSDKVTPEVKPKLVKPRL